MHNINAAKKIKESAANIVRNLQISVIETRYINIPRAKLFAMLRHIFTWELLIFICLYQVFIIAAVGFAFTRFIPYYKLFIPVWKKFYSVWSLHIILLSSFVPFYFMGVFIRFLLYKAITGGA